MPVVCKTMNKTKINLIVGNQNVSSNLVIKLIDETNNDHPFLYLTTHCLFILEKEFIKEKTKKQIIFKTFANFLTDKEMEWCDKEAYGLETKMNFPQKLRLNQYYNLIKELKNKLVCKKVKKKYFLKKKFLVADDLGIDKEVWVKIGCEPLLVVGNLKIMEWIKKGLNLLTTFKKIAKEIYLLFKQGEMVYVLEKNKKKYLFLGSLNRLKPRLGGTKISPYQLKIKLSFKEVGEMFILLVKRMLGKNDMKLLYTLCINDFKKIIEREKVSSLVSSIHEYNTSMVGLAENVGLKLMLFQDGFLPGNYTSRLYHYLFGVDKFLVWDRLAMELFEKQGLEAEISNFFNLIKLPRIKRRKHKIRKILVATSGAGDWTALKNRSDEDLMVEAFVKIARIFPEIEIIYRCHPLWVHPAHQGVNSIKRVDKYFKNSGLKNIRVSEQSMKQSKEFRGLWVPPKSMLEDIREADLVFGEHSIAMIDAAQEERVFASVNVTGRRDFFINYTRLGFPHLTNVREIVNFIKKMQEKEGEIQRYNRAIRIYNLECAG